jgi:CubicO group peptidase (beta-lactamase class C family)
MDVNRRYAALMGALLGLVLAGCGGGDSSGPAPLPTPTAPAAGVVGDGRLDALIEWARDSQNAPALTAVVVRNGQIVERGATGLRSTRSTAAVTSQDRWHVGSITKSMTATLAATLVEDGSITWDTTPLQVWPEFSNSIHADFRDVTLRQFLSHTSGLKRDDEFSGARNGAAGTVVEKRRAWAADLLASRAEHASGTWHYSNVAYVVAASMLEARGGASWESLLAARVFAPLGMTQTGFGNPSSVSTLDQPVGHRSRVGGFDPMSSGDPDPVWIAMGPAGNVHTTLDDVSRYLLAHLEGERGTPGLLSAETYATLHRPIAGGYALGWSEDPNFEPLDARTIWHDGSNGEWFAKAWFVPSRNVAVFVATNGGGDRAAASVRALSNLLGARLANSP